MSFKSISVVLSCTLALVACSEQPVGQSEYFDNPNVASAEVQPRLAQQQQVIRELRADNQARRNLGQVIRTVNTGDTALINSLDQAIADAGTPNVDPLAITPQQPVASASVQPLQPVQTPLASQSAQTVPAQLPTSDGITDNSFDTVVQNQTIETDAERLAAQAQRTVVLEAAPLPQTNTSVNLAAFARSTTHKIGERIYDRPNRSRSSANRACRTYGNPDEAQRAFLAAGGPQEDPAKIDPDGDGFVCGWSPIAFRNLRVGGN
jgi:hypothetical protein